LVFGVTPSQAQHRLKLIPVDSTAETQITDRALIPVEDATDAIDQARRMVSNARKRGFLTASIDSTRTDSNVTRAHVFFGHKYSWANIRFHPDAVQWLDKTRFARSGGDFSVRTFSQMVDELLEYGENHGYPFANIELDSIENTRHGLSAYLNLDKHRLFTYDTISIIGNAKVSTRFLNQYLGFKLGDVYNEDLTQNIDDHLNQLPYVKMVKPSRIVFVADKVKVYVYIDERKTDQIDGIIGFAPNTDNRLLLTGEANIKLQNIVRRGIGYALHWKSFNAQSQTLDMKASLPYLLQRPVGLNGEFNYIKFDTNFFTVQTQLGVNYLFSGTDYIKFYIQRKTSALISADTTAIRVSESLPESNPVNTASYGIQLYRRSLDNPRNPRKGIEFQLNGNVGTRNIQKDIRISEVVFRNAENESYTIYDSIDLKSVQAEISYGITHFLPVKKRVALVSSVSGKHLLANTIFDNDLYWFGGAKSLRGFNEQSLQASGYTMMTLEYRYLFGGNSFFQLFTNAAYLTNQNANSTDFPFGFGVGVNLDINNGVLNLAYALGSEQGNGIQLNQAKIHFGVINYL
jgi:outer membrane protein assembly factor BamA